LINNRERGAIFISIHHAQSSLLTSPLPDPFKGDNPMCDNMVVDN